MTKKINALKWKVDIIKKLKIIRLCENLSQKKFAEKIGILPRTYENYEQKVIKNPSFEVIVKVAKIYPEYSLWLLTGKTDPENNQISPDFKINELTKKIEISQVLEINNDKKN